MDTLYRFPLCFAWQREGRVRGEQWGNITHFGQKTAVKQYTLHILKGTGSRASNVQFFSFVCKTNCASIEYLLSHDHLRIFCCLKKFWFVQCEASCHIENPLHLIVTLLQLVVICTVLSFQLVLARPILFTYLLVGNDSSRYHGTGLRNHMGCHV
jgi:hypothetical protein